MPPRAHPSRRPEAPPGTAKATGGGFTPGTAATTCEPPATPTPNTSTPALRLTAPLLSNAQVEKIATDVIEETNRAGVSDEEAGRRFVKAVSSMTLEQKCLALRTAVRNLLQPKK